MFTLPSFISRKKPDFGRIDPRLLYCFTLNIVPLEFLFSLVVVREQTSSASVVKSWWVSAGSRGSGPRRALSD